MMNKSFKLVLAGLFCSLQLVASHSDCFRKYMVTLSNQSGGAADIKSTKGIRGASRKTELDNNDSIRILIQKRGAELTVNAGPENNKSTRTVKFYSKNFRNHNPSVTLNQKGFVAEGFSQKEVNFSVTIVNQSGGIAHILDTCEATGKGTTIADGKSSKITVKPSGYIVISSGPEKQKSQTKVVFADQTNDQPSLTLTKRGFFNKGVQSKGLEVQTQRVSVVRMHKKPTRKAVTRTEKLNDNASTEKKPRYTRARHRNRK